MIEVKKSCPEYDAEFGIRYEGNVPPMFEDALENYLQKEALKVLCPNCENWINSFQEE